MLSVAFQSYIFRNNYVRCVMLQCVFRVLKACSTHDRYLSLSLSLSLPHGQTTRGLYPRSWHQGQETKRDQDSYRHCPRLRRRRPPSKCRRWVREVIEDPCHNLWQGRERHYEQPPTFRGQRDCPQRLRTDYRQPRTTCGREHDPQQESKEAEAAEERER